RYFLFCTDRQPPLLYTLSLHDALPISRCARNHPGRIAWRACGAAAVRVLYREAISGELPGRRVCRGAWFVEPGEARGIPDCIRGDRKSTRLNSSHLGISYAVFCLKKKT